MSRDQKDFQKEQVRHYMADITRPKLPSLPMTQIHMFTGKLRNQVNWSPFWLVSRWTSNQKDFTMTKIFMLSVAGSWNEDEGRVPQFPTGSVYSQQGQLFAVIALFENHDSIQKLVDSINSNNSIAVKAANAAVRRLELLGVHFEDGKTVTYSRLNTVLRKEGRVVLYKTTEYEDGSTGDEKAYVIWKMGVNEWPVLDGSGGPEWWHNLNVTQD
jgi:hypothetical protein